MRVEGEKRERWLRAGLCVREWVREGRGWGIRLGERRRVRRNNDEERRGKYKKRNNIDFILYGTRINIVRNNNVNSNE